MKLCFATNNSNKIKEIQILLGGEYSLLGLLDIGCTEELEESKPTIEGNSKQKAEYIHKKYNVNVFADDTGLEVFALNGEPGVRSARYAGSQRDNDANIDLLLKNLATSENREAQFRTVITLFLSGEMHQFEGIAKGKIITEKKGHAGFGYDPIFAPENHDCTFAEMSLEEKNKISHRGRAVKKLVDFLKQKTIV